MTDPHPSNPGGYTPTEIMVIAAARRTLRPGDEVLVNNAGINIDRSLKNLSVEDWNSVLQVDLNSYFYTVKAALSYFTEQKSGKIINISSFVGQAIETGVFRDEIMPVKVPGRKGPTLFDQDQQPRADTTADGLARLRPAFKND